MAPQQQVQPHEQGEAIGMTLPACRRHLVIELGDPGNPQIPPRPHTMLTEGQGRFVTDDREGRATAHDGHGGQGVEPNDAAGGRASTEVPPDRFGPDPLDASPVGPDRTQWGGPVGEMDVADSRVDAAPAQSSRYWEVAPHCGDAGLPE
jgi:hypothetical protein